MITANRRVAQPARWQQAWREAITDPHELLAMLGLQDHASRLLPSRDTGFATRVPRGFAARMEAGNPDDPLLLQVLAQGAELADTPSGYANDAVGDLAARSASGVLQKYHGRALLIATGSCAVHCRYCFRRHFPYASETAAANQWRSAVEAIARDPSIAEVILSGGDPLSLSTAKLAELGNAIDAIGHVRRLRIHTRLPVVLPERVDDELCAWLGGRRQSVVVVVHVNHAREIDDAVEQACRRLAASGAVLLNQSVLLRRVNDSVAALAALSQQLIGCGVLPYYLHQLDRVDGTAHFEVDDDRARALVDQLRAELPGYLVPRLVREIAGESAKTPL